MTPTREIRAAIVAADAERDSEATNRALAERAERRFAESESESESRR